VGVLIGVFYFVLTGLAAGRATGGWLGGHSDLAFWWGVIAAFLGIAGLGCVVGTWIHTRPREG